jgi:hypothetical protein
MAQASGGIDIAQLISEFANVGAAQAAAKEKLTTTEDALNKSVEAQTGNITREAELTGQVQTLIDQIVLKRAGRNQQSAAEFGTNQDAQSYVLGKLGEQTLRNTEELTQSARDIAEEQQVGFFDDPMRWLTNQFTLPRQIGAHNQKVAEQEIVENAITKLQAHTLQSYAINQGLDANTSADIMHLNSQRLLVKAAQEVEKARQEAMKTNITIGSVRLAIDQNQFQNANSLLHAQVNLQQLKIAQANLGLSMELRQEQLKELKERHENDALLQEDLGTRRITPLQFKQMSGPMKDTLQFAMVDPNMAQGRLGFDPVSSVERANAVNAPLTPATQDIKNKLADLMTSPMQGNPAVWASLKPEQKHAMQVKAIKDGVETELRNIRDTGGLFSAPPLASIGKIPVVAETQLWKDYMAPLAKNPLVPTSAQQVFGIAANAVSEGKMTLDQAASDIATVYTAAVADNHHNRDYGRFAVQIPPQFRESYNTRLTLGGFTSGSIVNMSDQTAVKNAMLRYLNAQKSGSSPDFIGRFGPPQ